MFIFYNTKLPHRVYYDLIGKNLLRETIVDFFVTLSLRLTNVSALKDYGQS